jgi:hypothetical protein
MPHGNLYSMMYFLLRFLSMRDTFMFVELSNNTFSLFINNVFQSYKIILEYFCWHVRVACTLVLIESNMQENIDMRTC